MFSVDINHAPRELLLRISGIGQRSVERIIKTRRYTSIRDEDLPRIGIVYKKARPFITTADRHAAPLTLDSVALITQFRPKQKQLSLF